MTRAGSKAVPADSDARALRVRLLAEMAAADVPDADAFNMLGAVGEVMANAHRHGSGARALRIGRVGEHFVCEVSDHGAGLDDPLAGTCRRAPGTDAERDSGSPAR